MVHHQAPAVPLEVPSPAEINELAEVYESRTAEEVLQWALATYGRLIAISTSFQAEGMVILDMAYRIDPNVRVVTLDTGRLPQETYDLIDRAREHYQVPVEVVYPDQEELSQLVNKHGINPFYRSVSLRLLCCNIRKVNPMNRVLKDLEAWISGLRREEGETRARTRKIEIDVAHGGITKVNPLADWSYDEVWDYIGANDVPYNALYDRGYTSIGCAPCTRPVEPGEDRRAGRWWWEKGIPKECGIHLGPAWGRTT